MDEAEGHHSKQNKSDIRRKLHHLFSHMWNLDFKICLCKVTFNMEHTIESVGDLIDTPSLLRTPTFTRFSYFMIKLTEQKKKDIKYSQAMARSISCKEIQLVLCSWGRPPNCWLGYLETNRLVHGSHMLPIICMVPFLEKHARTQKVRVNFKL